MITDVIFSGKSKICGKLHCTVNSKRNYVKKNPVPYRNLIQSAAEICGLVNKYANLRKIRLMITAELLLTGIYGISLRIYCKQNHRCYQIINNTLAYLVTWMHRKFLYPTVP